MGVKQMSKELEELQVENSRIRDEINTQIGYLIDNEIEQEKLCNI